MASPRIIQAAVDRRTADLVHEELLNFVQNHSPGAVQKGQDKIFYFDTQLERKTPELQRTSAAVDGFLSKTGGVIAADFLGVPFEEVRCEKAFLILYCSRGTKRNTRGSGRVTIFLALGELSLFNGLPTIGDANQALSSGDAFAVRSEETQILGETDGGGLALVSDWS